MTTIASDNQALVHCFGLVKIKYATKPGEVEQGKEGELRWDGFKRRFSKIRASPTTKLNVGSTYDKLNNYGV